MTNTAGAEALYRSNEAAYGWNFSDERVARAHHSACGNADDTQVERGFKYHSGEWFECYAATFEFCIDMGEKF